MNGCFAFYLPVCRVLHHAITTTLIWAKFGTNVVYSSGYDFFELLPFPSSSHSIFLFLTVSSRYGIHQEVNILLKMALSVAMCQ